MQPPVAPLYKQAIYSQYCCCKTAEKDPALSTGQGGSLAERKAAMYYTSCIDANQTVATLGSRPLTDLLWKTFGGWSVTEPRKGDSILFNETAWDFQRTLEQTHALGIYGFVSVWVAEDDKMPTRNILQVSSL